MKMQFIATLILLCMGTGVMAQSTQIDLSTKFTKHKIHTVDVDEILPQLREDNFSMNFTIGDLSWDIALQKSNVVADHYEFTAVDDQGEHTTSGSHPKAYNGYVLGTSDSRVVLTFNEDFIYGYIRDSRGTTYIEPLRYYQSNARADEFITYKVKDVIPDHTAKCGVEKKHEKYRSHHDHAERGSRVGECFEVEWSVVSDFQMFQDFGSISGVENHNIGVANDVQTNYDDEFADEIQLIIVEQIVFTTAGSDPFTNSNDAGTVLDDFTDWGPTGFNQIHDVGSLWTGRNFNGGTVGIAWLGAVCTSIRYNALMNFTNNANSKRVMVAHELGHNFDAVHDAPGSGFIMAPSVNSTNTWSNASIADIQNFYGFIGCLASCPPSGVAPDADFITTVTNDCVIGSAVFTDNSSNAPTSWLWTFEGGTPSTSTSQNPTVTYNNPGTFNVTLEVSNVFGTDVLLKTDEVTISATPEANWFVVTNGLLALFNNNSTGGDSYFWDFGDGTFSNSEDPVHNYMEDGVYTVSLTVTNDCGADTFTQEVTIVSVPIADFSGTPTSGCYSLTVTFQDESSNNTTGWAWEFEGGAPATSTAQNPTVTYNTEGVFRVTLVATNASGDDTMIKEDYITVDPPAMPGFTLEVDADQVIFTNTSTNADTYMWDFGDGSTSTDVNPVHNYSISGTYTVTLTATGPCGPESISQEVEISLLPVAGFAAAGDTEGCPDLTIAFTDNSSADPTSWMWTFEGGTPAMSMEQNPTVIYSTPGTYDVTLIATNALGSDTTTLEDYIEVFADAEANFNFTNTALEVSFNNMSTAATSFMWDFGDGMTSIEESPTHTYDAEGIYEVTLTSTGPCNSSVTTMMINLYTAPTAGFMSDVTEGCADLTIQFMEDASDNVTSYMWTFEGGSPASSTEANPMVTYDVAGSYDVTLTVSNPAGEDMTSSVEYVAVFDIPNASFNVMEDETTVSFTNTSTDADAFLWDFGDGESSTEENPIHTYTTEGEYTVTLTATNSCGDQVSTTTVSAFALPVADGSASANAICESEEVQFTDESSDNVTAWSWTFEGGTPAMSTEQNPVVLYDVPGTYDVTLTVTAPAGTDMITFENIVTVAPLPDPSFEAVNNMQEVNFTNTSVNADTYVWDFGDGTTSTEENPTHIYADEGEYIVTLTASNTCGDVIVTETVTANSLPTASGLANTTFGCGTTEITFADNSSDNVTAWSWTFEGGTPATSTEQNPTVIYNAPGVYDVTLRVTADAGTDEVVYEDLIEIEGIPSASFDFTVDADDLTYNFSYTGDEGEVFNWDFGDGTTSIESDPTHTYADYGEYTVTLVVSNECSDADSQATLNIINDITELELIHELKIYPNPLRDLFYLDLELAEAVDLEIQVMDIHGRLIVEDHIIDQGTQVTKAIDMSAAASGTYLVRIVNGNQVRNAKIVVQR